MPLSRQAELLTASRASIYYKPHPDEYGMQVKLAIDKLHTAEPWLGSRRLSKWLLEHNGLVVNRKAAQRHMREMGIQALYPKPSTSAPQPGSKICPCLLGGLHICKPDQVWGIDITYVPIKKSLLYLVAILDWHSRYVASWEIDDTLEIGFVLDACQKALGKSNPGIINSDQGSQFTSPKYISLFEEKSRISMDHRGRAFGNISTERLWRTLKYENVYISDYQAPRDARVGISQYMSYYNERRLHQSLGYRAPIAVYNDRQ